MEESKILYRLDDDIVFRKCSLFNGERQNYGDCTNFSEQEKNWTRYFYCNQNGIHLHCANDPEIEFDIIREEYSNGVKLICPKCKKEISVANIDELRKRCLRTLNREIFKNAKVIRLDDWYFHEVKKKEKISDYWINTNVKTDKDGDTMIVVYVGVKESNEKAQLFIKPEKLQLSSDHKDMDPAKVLSKIEVTLRDRTLIQKYDD